MRKHEVDHEKDELSFEITTNVDDDQRVRDVLSSFMRSAGCVSSPTISGIIRAVETNTWYAIVARRDGRKIEAHVMEQPSAIAAQEMRVTILGELGIEDVDPIHLPPRGQA